MLSTLEICKLAPVIPVVTIESVETAVPLAKALVAGGLRVIEVTLRTPAALEAIGAIKDAVPDAIVGAGTLRSSADVVACLDQGAVFGVSPGSPPGLLDAARAASLPMLPGCSTATEAMVLAEQGYEVLKFFPAGPAGGPSFLKSLAAPLPDIHFCPTGGVSEANATDYLSLVNVVCVGGSWVAPKAAIDAGDWGKVTELSRAATGLKAG